MIRTLLMLFWGYGLTWSYGSSYMAAMLGGRRIAILGAGTLLFAISLFCWLVRPARRGCCGGHHHDHHHGGCC